MYRSASLVSWKSHSKIVVTKKSNATRCFTTYSSSFDSLSMQKNKPTVLLTATLPVQYSRSFIQLQRFYSSSRLLHDENHHHNKSDVPHHHNYHMNKPHHHLHQPQQLAHNISALNRGFHSSLIVDDNDDMAASSNNSPFASFSSSHSVSVPGMTSSTTQRPQMRIGDLLKGLEYRNFAVTEDCSVEDAIAHLVKEKLGSALVTNDSGAVLGIFTARDLLKFINEKSPHNPNFHLHMKNATQGTHVNLHECLAQTKITEVMTKREKLIYCSPSDSVKHCREIMFQLKIRNLPVLDGNRIRGIITMKVLADAYFNATDVGGKKSYMSNVTGRKGIPDTAKVSLTNSSSGGIVSDLHGVRVGEYIDIPNSKFISAFLDLEVGYYALPHPFKHASGVAIDRRNYGPFDLATDLSLSEDALFAIRVKDPLFSSCPTHIFEKATASESTDTPLEAMTHEDLMFKEENIQLPVGLPQRDSQVYLCVADGVGSWRQFGVDPRNYPVTLADNARRVIEADFSHRALMGSSPFDRDLDPIHPLDVMVDAWNVTTSEQVMGSCTFCIATLDKKLNQLHYSNVGDGGLMVLRRTNDAAEGTAGFSGEKKRNRQTQSPWKVAYLSQQQMKSFNLPYQLGNNPRINEAKPPEKKVGNTATLSPEEAKKQREEEEFWMYAPRNFDTPADADTASIPIMPGDLVILATDGLFDNMDLEDVVQVVTAWEQEKAAKNSSNNNNNKATDMTQTQKSTQNLDMYDLAYKLVTVSREFSLDRKRDGPFALLAKENDILWSGGMPDDTSVVVARVVKDVSP